MTTNYTAKIVDKYNITSIYRYERRDVRYLRRINRAQVCGQVTKYLL